MGTTQSSAADTRKAILLSGTWERTSRTVYKTRGDDQTVLPRAQAVETLTLNVHEGDEEGGDADRGMPTTFTRRLTSKYRSGYSTAPINTGFFSSMFSNAEYPPIPEERTVVVETSGSWRLMEEEDVHAVLGAEKYQIEGWSQMGTLEWVLLTNSAEDGGESNCFDVLPRCRLHPGCTLDDDSMMKWRHVGRTEICAALEARIEAATASAGRNIFADALGKHVIAPTMRAIGKGVTDNWASVPHRGSRFNRNNLFGVVPMGVRS